MPATVLCNGDITTRKEAVQNKAKGWQSGEMRIYSVLSIPLSAWFHLRLKLYLPLDFLMA